MHFVQDVCDSLVFPTGQQVVLDILHVAQHSVVITPHMLPHTHTPMSEIQIKRVSPGEYEVRYILIHLLFFYQSSTIPFKYNTPACSCMIDGDTPPSLH